VLYCIVKRYLRCFASCLFCPSLFWAMCYSAPRCAWCRLIACGGYCMDRGDGQGWWYDTMRTLWEGTRRTGLDLYVGSDLTLTLVSTRFGPTNLPRTVRAARTRKGDWAACLSLFKRFPESLSVGPFLASMLKKKQNQVLIVGVQEWIFPISVPSPIPFILSTPLYPLPLFHSRTLSLFLSRSLSGGVRSAYPHVKGATRQSKAYCQE